MKVIICGDRNWEDQEMIKQYIATLPKDTLIIQGMCRGADWLARLSAKELGYQIKDYPANWDLHGLAAGPIRNRQMLEEKPDLVVAFHDNNGTGKGTKDMLNAAKQAGVSTKIFTHYIPLDELERIALNSGNETEVRK